jgi:transcriptional regulator with XRE-family HTH domain
MYYETPMPKQKPKNLPPWANALKLRRVALGKSQEEVANDSQVLTQRTVSELENAKYTPDSLTVSRLVALARGLEWTLFDLQTATGLDLSLGEPGEKLIPAPVQTFKLFPIREATKWPAAMDDFKEWPAHVWNQHARPGLAVFFEGEDPSQGGTLHYIDTHDRNPESEQFYLVVTEGQAKICEYKANTGIGIYLSPTGIHNPTDVTVIGHRYMQTTMRPAPSRIAN